MCRSETRSEFCRWTWIDVVQLSLNFSVYLAGYDLSAKRLSAVEYISGCADAKIDPSDLYLAQKVPSIANKAPESGEQLHPRITYSWQCSI